MAPKYDRSNVHRVVVDSRSESEGIYQCELRACGKRTCGRCGGSKPRHGPYWYLYQWLPAGPDSAKRWRKGRQRSVYIGKRFERRIG